jgi:hypothetical protein
MHTAHADNQAVSRFAIQLACTSKVYKWYNLQCHSVYAKPLGACRDDEYSVLL